MRFSMRHANDDKYNCHQEAIIDKRFNGCQVVKSTQSSILLRHIIEDFSKSCNFELACPFKVGSYELRKMSLTLPPILPIPSGYYCVEFSTSARSKSSKKMEPCLSAIIKIQLK